MCQKIKKESSYENYLVGLMILIGKIIIYIKRIKHIKLSYNLSDSIESKISSKIKDS